MSATLFIDQDDYPFAEFAADNEIAANPWCVRCAGTGEHAGQPCSCMVAEAFRLFPAAADASYAVESCEECTGDGELLDGRLCPCLLVSFRAAHSAIRWT